MPFYEYQCRACGEETEVLQKLSDAPLRKCPACGKNQLEKLISAPVFRLKGGGWYETDFKSEGEKKRNLAGEEGGAEKPAEGGEKAETKSDAGAADKAAATPAKTSKPAVAAKPAVRPTASKKPAPARSAAAAKPASRKPAPAKKTARPAARGKAAARARR